MSSARPGRCCASSATTQLSSVHALDAVLTILRLLLGRSYGHHVIGHRTTRKAVAMRRTLIRQISVGTAVAVVAAAAAGAAFAAPKAGHGRFGAAEGGPERTGSGRRLRARRPGFGGRFAGRRSAASAVAGLGFGARFRRPGAARRPGGGILARRHPDPGGGVPEHLRWDLAADLKGGKTLAQEATAKGKTPADLIDAIVAARRRSSTPKSRRAGSRPTRRPRCSAG